MDDRPWGMVAAAVTVVVGSLLPWATLGIFSLAGTDGDGVLTLAAGIVAGAVGLIRGRSTIAAWTAVACGLFTVAIAGNVFMNLSDSAENIGTGLLLTLAAGLGLTIVGFVSRPQEDVAASIPTNPTDRLHDLERLAALRERGALTEVEFAQQKRSVLDENPDSPSFGGGQAFIPADADNLPAGTACQKCGYVQNNPRAFCKACKSDLIMQGRERNREMALQMLADWERSQSADQSADGRSAADDLRDKVVETEPGILDRFVQTAQRMSEEGRDFSQRATMDVAVRRSGYLDIRRRVANPPSSE